MDENRRKSAEIHQLALGRVSFHTVCLNYAQVIDTSGMSERAKLFSLLLQISKL
jgi:hypothetical protein